MFDTDHALWRYFEDASTGGPTVCHELHRGLSDYATGGAGPWRTSLTAFKLGLASFIVPYMFVFAPAILGFGSVLDMMIYSLTAVVSVIARRLNLSVIS
jgi:hypothetical protein